MEYKCIKVIYEQLGNTKLEDYQQMAYDMIKYAKEKLGNDQFHKYYYNSIRDALKLMNKKYGTNQKLPKADSELEEELRWKTETKRNQCIFWTFLVMAMWKSNNDQVEQQKKKEIIKQKERLKNKKENKEGKDESPWEQWRNNYKNKYIGILNKLFSSNGMEVLINSSMDNAILDFSLATQQPWYVWVDMQAEWNLQRGNHDRWQKKHSEWRSLKYLEFKREIEEGLKKDNRTGTSYSVIDGQNGCFNRIKNDYIDKKERKADEKECEEISAHPTVSSVFSEAIRATLENAEWRRTWYFYRMISLVIDNQIEEIIKIAKRVKKYNSKVVREQLNTLLNKCWLRTNSVIVLKKLLSVSDDEGWEEELRDYFNGCSLTIENIAKVFNESLGVYKEQSVFVKPKYRFAYYFPELIKEYLDDPNKRTNREIINIYFNSKDDIENIYNEVLTGSKRNARLFGKILSGETIISKEILLLTALIVKKQGIREMNNEYINNHILKNCRYDTKLDEERNFDKFFLDSFKNVWKLSDNAMAFEMQQLKNGKGAVFYNIIRGKEIETCKDWD